MSFWRWGAKDKVGPAPVTELTDKAFDMFIKGNPRAVVEIYMVGCSHCNHMAPVYEKVARSMNGRAAFARMDGVKHRQAPQLFAVSVTPTFLFFKGGNLVETVQGEMLQTELEGHIIDHLT